MDAEQAKRLQGRYNQLSQLREDHEHRWEDAVRYVLPMLSRFEGDDEWNDERMDTTATNSLAMLADGMFGNVCPPAINWFKYRFADAELNDDKNAVEWLQECESRMYEAYLRSNFYDVMPQAIKVGAGLGTVTLNMQEDAAEQSVLFTVRHPREMYYATDMYGRINTLVREFKLTAEQAVEQFGEEELSPQIQRAAKNQPYDQFDFLHFVMPRAVRDFGKIDNTNFPFMSVYMEKAGFKLVKESGFKTWPSPTWRWEVRGGEVYGYSPTDDAMPDIKTVNAMMKTLLEAAHKTVNPPVFMPEQMAGDIDLNPGGENYYRDPGLRPFVPNIAGNYPIGKDLLEDMRGRIRQTYKTDHFLMLMQQEGQMTAREVLERKSEKVTVIGSTIGRFTSEFLDPIQIRFFQIEMDAGRLPPPPQNVQGASLRIDYLGPLAQAQKEIHTSQGILKTLQVAVPIIEIWPETRDKFKPDVMMEEILEAHGMPEKAIRSDKEYQQIQQQKAEAAAQQQQMEQAATMAQAAPQLQQMQQQAAAQQAI